MPIDGLNPTSYHVFNLVVHCLSALLLMAIVRQILHLACFREQFATVGDGLAFLAALAWALHPLQVETVVYVTQRTELMVGLCYFATFYASLRYWSAGDSGRRVWLALAVLASLAGMACKEVMVTAPVLILLFERTFIAGSFRGAWRNSWQLYAGLFATWALLIWLNYTGPAVGDGWVSFRSAGLCVVVHASQSDLDLRPAGGLAVADVDSLLDAVFADRRSNVAVAGCDLVAGGFDSCFFMAAATCGLCGGLGAADFVPTLVVPIVTEVIRK